MAGASSDRNMKLYLEANLAKFARKDSSLGYRLTRYVDGLDYGAPFVPKYSTCARFINDERHL